MASSVGMVGATLRQAQGRLFAGTTVGFPGFPHRAGEGGFQTRPYRRERLSASNIAYRRADTWVICSN